MSNQVSHRVHNEPGGIERIKWWFPKTGSYCFDQLQELKESNGDFLRQEVTATTNCRNMIESNDDFLRQEVTAATNCRDTISIELTERKDHLNEGEWNKASQPRNMCQSGARRKPHSPCRNGGTSTVANFTSRRANIPEGGRVQRRSVESATMSVQNDTSEQIRSKKSHQIGANQPFRKDESSCES